MSLISQIGQKIKHGFQEIAKPGEALAALSDGLLATLEKNPYGSMILARTIDGLNLSEEQRLDLLKITPENWEAVIQQLKTNQLFQKYVRQGLSTGVVSLSSADQAQAEASTKEVVVTVLAGIGIGLGILAAIWTIAAGLLAAIAALTAIPAPPAAAFFGLCAGVCTIVAGLLALAGGISGGLALVLDKTLPSDETSPPDASEQQQGLAALGSMLQVTF